MNGKIRPVVREGCFWNKHTNNLPKNIYDEKMRFHYVPFVPEIDELPLSTIDCKVQVCDPRECQNLVPQVESDCPSGYNLRDPWFDQFD